ncbi:MAG: PAS domain-containing protein [Planctomycetes bacterium]|nr:PAS domain-containing protein [Planctomycetota bacterium]
MNLSRTLSLIVATTAAIVLAVVLLGAPEGGWAWTETGWWIVPGVILIAAGAIALVHYVCSSALIDRPLQSLRKRIDMLDGETAAAPAAPIDGWLAPLSQAIDRTLCQHRARVDQLRTDRRELEIQVRVADAERKHAEAILHSISDAVIVTDAFNEVALANETAAITLRFNLTAARRQPIDRVISDPALIKLIKDMRESGRGRASRHIEHRITSSGRAKVYDVTLACVSTDEGDVTGVVTILRDVTREKEIAEMKSDFVSGVSHELRTPLSCIKAYVEMLVDGEAADEQTRADFYNIIQSETNRLSRLIDNILNINRIESGIIRVQREDICLSSVISDAVEVMRPQARAKQISLTEQGSPLGYSIYADKDMMYQVLLNLISNAIKYTPAGGKITIDTLVDDVNRSVTVSVTDTGVGIPEDAMPHLFGKFYRVPDHKKIAKGTGLGLNLVKHVVETVHMGKVRVESKLGEGSRFSVTLPISDSAVTPIASPTGGAA